ncbi:MAG: sigma-70 family RNA polymerase sigma factor [bacterium]
MADNNEHSGGALPASYEEIVREYGKRVMAVAYDYVKDYDAAQDVAQEVFIRIWKKGDEFQAQASVFSWIYRITVNLAIDHLRKAKSRGKLSDSEGTYRDIYETEQHSGSTKMRPGLSMEQRALRERLDEALEVLSENQKQAFVLRYYQEMDIEAIAAIMGCKESTVRQHLFRASHKLRDELADLADRFLPPNDEEERDDGTS